MAEKRIPNMTSVNLKAERMHPPRPTELAHTLLSEVIRKGDSVVDATCGNGHDTIVLAALTGEQGKVIAYDIQEAAIRETAALAKHAGFQDRIILQLKSHARMTEDVEAQSVRAIAFNLGYLPGEDHGITTISEETLKALDAASQVLMPSGAISIVCYPGHGEGTREAERVEAWVEQLPEKGWRVAKYAMVGTRKPAPFLLFALKGE